MSDLRAAVVARMPRRQTECRVCRYLATLDDDMRKQWEELLAEPNQVITAKAIGDEMTERMRAEDPSAESINYVSVTKHRGGHG